jgi:DNA invertase Pin-like site-specific DNA recombinase
MYYNYLEDIKPEEVLIYLRKSRSDDPTLTVEEVLSKHETMLDEWTERNMGALVPQENRFYEVMSGETIKERPEFQKILRMIESPKYRAVLVVEAQRLSRGDLEDAGRLIKLFRYTNTLVLSIQKNYDIRDEYDRDAFERELKRGNEYLEYTKKIMNNGRLLSVSQGNFIGSIAPYGYKKVAYKEGKRKCHTLEEVKADADIVRLIFDLYVNKDMGRESICNYLDNMGVKPPKGEYWSAPALKDMLENVHYIGKVKWNWRKTVTIVEDSEIIKTRPKSKVGEYLIYEGKHNAIVSEELFNAAREKQGKNYRARPNTKVRNPLAGLLYCRCGRGMSLRYNYNKGELKGSPRLICNNQKHCKSGSVLYDEMIDRIAAVLGECIEDFEVRIGNNEESSAKLHATLIKNLENRMEELKAKELSQWEAQSDPNPAKRMPQEIFQQLNEKLLKEKEEVQQALCKAYEAIPEPINYEERVATFKEALAALKDPEADAMKKNKLLRKCIERIEYTRERPERLKGKTGQHGGWSVPEIELDIKLKV